MRCQANVLPANKSRPVHPRPRCSLLIPLWIWLNVTASKSRSRCLLPARVFIWSVFALHGQRFGARTSFFFFLLPSSPSGPTWSSTAPLGCSCLIMQRASLSDVVLGCCGTTERLYLSERRCNWLPRSWFQGGGGEGGGV